MAGEFRCVVKRADGSTKIDTGYQKNLILNQGLDFFGGGNGEDMMEYCVIGNGNSQPIYTQNKLDNAITVARRYKQDNSLPYKSDYDANRDGNLFKCNRVCKYIYTSLDNVNISELGLASTYANNSNYYLCTRALIKDVNGNPTTITVLSGEQLEIYYKLWQVFDVSDKTGQINLLDGVGGSVAYNYTVRLANVGNANYYGYFQPYYHDFGIGMCGLILKQAQSSNAYSVFDNYFYSDGIANITSVPKSIIGQLSGIVSYAPYIAASYKRVMTLSIPIADANGNIRSIAVFTTMGIYQIQYDSVADNSPITKTNTQTLTIPIEISWGRYEGEL